MRSLAHLLTFMLEQSINRQSWATLDHTVPFHDQNEEARSHAPTLTPVRACPCTHAHVCSQRHRRIVAKDLHKYPKVACLLREMQRDRVRQLQKMIFTVILIHCLCEHEIHSNADDSNELFEIWLQSKNQVCMHVGMQLKTNMHTRSCMQRDGGYDWHQDDFGVTHAGDCVRVYSNAYAGLAYIVIAHIVIAYIAMICIVMAYIVRA